jgi:REP element-mobilizing transposase RayT
MLIQAKFMPRRSRPAQLGFRFRTWGGSRPGAGRPPKGLIAGVSHLARPALSRHHPVHVTLSITRGIESLRGSAMFRAVRGALAGARARFGFRLVHFSVQRDHLHLLAEASDRRALSRGMQGLTIRVAKAVNRRLGRSGRVFGDRYHARTLKTPREARWALRYVLSNARKHGRGVPSGFVDGCSSAPWFRGWARPSTLAFVSRKELRERDAPVVAPTTWLLRVGYLRAGPIDVDDAPGRAAPG